MSVEPKVTLDLWKQRVSEAQNKTAAGNVTTGSGSDLGPAPGTTAVVASSNKNVPIDTKSIRPDTEDRLTRCEQEMVVVKRQIYGSQSEAGMVRHIQEMEGKWENIRQDYFELKRKYLKLLALLGVDDPDIAEGEKNG